MATYFTHIEHPWLVFTVSMIISFVGGAQAFFLSKDLETNEYAQIKDQALLKYEE